MPKIGIGDDADGSRLEQQTDRDPHDYTDHKQEDCRGDVFLDPIRRSDRIRNRASEEVDDYDGRHADENEAQAHEQPEMAAIDVEAAVENLPDLHRPDIGVAVARGDSPLPAGVRIQR